MYFNTPKFVRSRTEIIKKGRNPSMSIQFELWRTALREYRERVDITYHQIAVKENLSEKAVARVFTGESKNPGVDIVRRIIHAMGATWQDIFADSDAVITTHSIEADRAELNQIKTERDQLIAENLVLANKLKEAEANIMLLSIKLEYEQKITALHTYYTKAKEE